MGGDFFGDVTGPIPFGGLGSTDQLSYKVYEPDRLILGKRMEDHLRIAVCLWHSFAWPGSDVFGSGTFDRPWLLPGVEPMAAARTKLEAAFEFVNKLGAPNPLTTAALIREFREEFFYLAAVPVSLQRMLAGARP